jgi:hypothetical protein
VGRGFESIRQLSPQRNMLTSYSTEDRVERDGVFFVMEKDKKIK